MESKNTSRMTSLLFYAFLAALIYFAIRYFFFLLFPIAAALVFSQIIRASFLRLRPLSPAVKRILIILILLIFFSLLSLIVILLTDLLIHGISNLSTGISDHSEDISALFQDGIRRVESAISALLKRDMENSLLSRVPSLMEHFSQKFLEWVPTWIASLVAWIPKFFLSLFIFVICTYYFSCDWKRLSNLLCKWLKTEKTEKLRQTKRRLFRGLHQYLKAYALLFLMTFSELFLGLVLLRVPAAVGWALGIALFDILPIFGCGAILLPWSLVMLLSGNHALGVGLLILNLIIFLVRQFAEPKIVGDCIGLHPVFSLILVIVGLSLFGFFGMILLPLAVTCLAVGEENENEKKSLQ